MSAFITENYGGGSQNHAGRGRRCRVIDRSGKRTRFEPFFGKDEQFSQSGSAEHKMIFKLGDRFHFRSALISFRRIWMPREPSHWKAVSAVLTRQGMPAQISLQASVQAKLIEDYISEPAPYLNNETTGNRVIDLWLNTVFAHAGISGRNKRSDFEGLLTNMAKAGLNMPFGYW
jgi:hypothetical protein